MMRNLKAPPSLYWIPRDPVTGKGGYFAATAEGAVPRTECGHACGGGCDGRGGCGGGHGEKQQKRAR